MNHTGATMEKYHHHCNKADLNANESHNIVQGGVVKITIRTSTNGLQG